MTEFEYWESQSSSDRSNYHVITLLATAITVVSIKVLAKALKHAVPAGTWSISEKKRSTRSTTVVFQMLKYFTAAH